MENLTLEELVIVEEIGEIKEYSRTEYGMPIDSFNELDLEKGKMFFWVYASPKDEIRQIFKNSQCKQYENEAEALK